MTSLETARAAGGFDLPSLAGGGRRELSQLADRSLLALRPWATPGHARFDLPGPGGASGRVVDGVEAFARSFLAAGFQLAGSDSDPHDHAGWYAHGLAAGVDPASAEHWPSPAAEAQNRVEAAALSIALHESRSWIWDNLPPLVQEQLVDWLSGSTGAWYPESNWRWFHNVTQAFLRSVGAPHDQAQIDEWLGYFDSCYAGDGWYSDGGPPGRFGNIDWYSGWVMQQFPLWYCRMSAGEPGIEERQAVYAERLRRYVEAAVALHGANGAPLYQGRSLVYRYATVGALWTGAVFDASPLPPGQLRHVAMGAIDYFVQRGAFNDNGLLSLGWHGEFPEMRQNYSGPGSPYWANFGMAGLVLPESHPLWSAPDLRAPIEEADQLTAMPAIGWLASGTTADGIVRVANHGVDHSGPVAGPERPLYNRLAYSTVTAPLAATTGSEAGVADNQVALVDASGRWSHRSLIEKIAVQDGRAESRYLAHFALTDVEVEPGPWVRTISLVRGPVEVRAAKIESPFEGRSLVISGYPVPRVPSPGARTDLVSEVVGLSHGAVDGHSDHAEQSAFGSDIVVPWTRYERPVPGRWYVASVSLIDHASADQPSEHPELWELESGGFRIAWQDGSSDRVG